MSAGSASLQPPMQVNLGLTYGAYLIGAIAAAVLYGILISQTMFYYNQYSKDPLNFKILVASLLFLETLTVVTEAYGLYHYLIVTFGNLGVLQVQFWAVQLEALIAYTVMLITQAFFIIRIWELTGRKWLFAGILTFLTIAAFGSALAIVVKIFLFKYWSSSLLPYMKAVVATNKSLETFVDALITGGLCYYLNRGRSQVKRTNSMINRLIVFAVNRGAITTFLQLCYLITYLAKPDSMAWVAIHVTISKVYSNSVLATLNSRNSIRGVGEDEELMSVMVTQPLKFTHAHDSVTGVEEMSTFQATTTVESGGNFVTKSLVSESTIPVEISLHKTTISDVERC